MDNSEANCVFFKKRARQTIRSKKESSSSEEEIEVKRRAKRQEYSGLHQQTPNFSKKSRGLSDDEGTNEVAVAYKASRSMESHISREHCATATYELDADHSCDAQAIFERAQKLNKEQGSQRSKVYMGVNNYAQYIEKKDTVLGNASSGFNRKGPMRAPTNLRATVRWDYQPDICKDYKETGFCSFGDSCKFLHDRSDYKHGWQIEQELMEGTYGIEGNDNRYEIGHHSSEEEAQDEDIPLQCLICRKDYKDPVVTTCRHYFCEECALKRYKKTARCYACTADTKGFFKFAKDLLPRLAAIRAKRKKGKDHSSDEEDDQNTSFHRPGLPHSNSDHANLEESGSPESAGIQTDDTSSKVKLPVPSEPKWAEPETVQYCDSDEESD